MSNSTVKRKTSNFIDIFSTERKAQTIELAIKLYTNSIEHDPTELSFYSLRSYCYSESGEFEAALKDALEVTDSREWKNRPHGWFVMEKALAGQRIYKEAADAQKKVEETKKYPEEDVEKILKSKIRRDFIIWSASKEILNSTGKSNNSHAGGDVGEKLKVDRKEEKPLKHKDSDKKRRRSPEPPTTKPEVKNVTSPNHRNERPSLSPPPRRQRETDESRRTSGRPPPEDHFKVVDSFEHTGNDIPAARNHEEPRKARSRSTSRGKRDVSDNRTRNRSPRGSPPRSRPRRSRSTSRPKEMPVNIYRFTGIRIRNIWQGVYKTVLRDFCERYGHVIDVEMKEREREAIVSFTDAEAPRKAIADLHNVHVSRISHFNDKLIVRFALGFNQDKFHMRNVRRVECDECHFFRTTGCEDKSCPETHIPFNSGIDLQPWMKRST